MLSTATYHVHADVVTDDRRVRYLADRAPKLLAQAGNPVHQVQALDALLASCYPADTAN